MEPKIKEIAPGNSMLDAEPGRRNQLAVIHTSILLSWDLVLAIAPLNPSKHLVISHVPKEGSDLHAGKNLRTSEFCEFKPKMFAQSHDS